ncbi:MULTISPECIES: hypothetical protein [unclassified Bradyrhizobium]|uniref:hypothetical protein n=1 Tax=unclassified Bradyrhizobium TaxID=2631580 RepID=UPI0028EC4E19|nr:MULTISPECIES: hypothetical protein [unclassified Bradyrhizobium]
MGLLDALAPEPVPEIRPDTPHYEAVGRFVTSFANAEAAIHMLARHLSGLSDEKARIIFGGMRLPDISDVIRQIARIDNIPAEIFEVIDGCLTQFGLIAKRRHSLVHRSSTFFDGKIISTNVLTTKSLKAVEGEVFDIQELSDMQIDCLHIYLRLCRVYLPKTKLPSSSTAHEKIIYGTSWRYKHVPPRTPNLKPRAKSAKSQHQPPSSPEKP